MRIRSHTTCFAAEEAHCHAGIVVLLHALVTLGVFRRAETAGHRAPPSRQARAQALRLPGGGAENRRRSHPYATETPARLPRHRTRALARLSRHAPESYAPPLPAGESAGELEQ